ncbi:hypothetical protein T4E_4284 [Trichinella pseudospiralis]|uniref:Uncharacterized protein n=1 Tax=Trichinella pseudospiralis TaxID=6337 RepID=A0A0V0Y149_TRIPS|nr:hypothetical protein T4E_4284 [Trichinella pseudospiralis]
MPVVCRMKSHLDSYQRDVNVESPTSVPSALPVSVFGVNSTVPVGSSGIYPSPMASNLCRTQSNSTGSGSPHPIPSPLFYTSMSHAGYQASSLIPTPMQLSHYGNNLRAMTAFGNINSTPACITANLRRFSCKLCAAVSVMINSLQAH